MLLVEMNIKACMLVSYFTTAVDFLSCSIKFAGLIYEGRKSEKVALVRGREKERNKENLSMIASIMFDYKTILTSIFSTVLTCIFNVHWEGHLTNNRHNSVSCIGFENVVNTF